MAILQHQIIQRPVADVTTLKALDVTLYADGAIITVRSKGVYRYDKTSSKTPDDDRIVQPAVGSGRWLRMTYAEIDEHAESFTDLDDVDSAFYTKANAIVTNNNVPDGLVEGEGTLSPAGALKVVSVELSLGSVVNEISNDTTLEDKSTSLVTEHVAKDIKDKAQPLNTDLTALAALNTDGLVTRTGTSTYATRAIVGAANQINVADGDGIAGNPTLTTPQDIAITSSPTFASLSTTGNINGATPTEMSYLSGVTSAIQPQLNAKAPGFAAAQIYYVDENGSDTLNDGKSEQTPFKTLAKAEAEALAQVPSSTNQFAIVCLSGSVFTEDIISRSYCHTYLPNATIAGKISVQQYSSLKLNTLLYSGTGIALEKNAGGNEAFCEIDQILCTSSGKAVQNSIGEFEVNIDRIETLSGGGVYVANDATYTSGYINTIQATGGGNCVTVTAPSSTLTKFNLSFGRLYAPSGSAISLTANSILNINAREIEASNAYTVNSSGAVLNLNVSKLSGSTTVTSGTDNVINVSGDSSFGGKVKATSFEGATDNTITGFSNDVTMAADSATLGITQHVIKTLDTKVDAIAAGLHWQAAVIDEVDFTTAEPASPSVTDRYINTVSGTSSITAQSVTANYIYEDNSVDWTETVVTEGFAVYVLDEHKQKEFNGTAWVDIGVGGIANVVDDLTPQLGGNLDVNGKSIVSVSNGNIVITPNGTGNVVLDGLKWPQTDGASGQSITTNSLGQLLFATVGGGLPDQVNTYLIGKNGNDANDGLQLGKPKITVANANAVAVAKTPPTGGTPSKFYVTDNGIYTGDSFTSVADSVYECFGATFSNSNIYLKAGVAFSCHKFIVTSGNGVEHYSSSDGDPTYFNANVVSNSVSGRAILNEGNSSNVQYHRIGLLLHSSSNSCITIQLGLSCFDIDEIRTSGTAAGYVFNISGDTATNVYINIKKLDASGMSSAIPVFQITYGNVYIQCDEVIGVSSTYQLFGIGTNANVYFNNKKITNALVSSQFNNIKYYNLSTALLNFNPPKNLLVSGDFYKMPLWVKGVGLSSFADATPVTPSFLILHNATADVQRNTSNKNELVLQLTGTGYLGGYESLYSEEFLTYLTDLKSVGETLSVGFYGNATGISNIKMDLIQWVHLTNIKCLKDPVATWGATPTLASNSTGAWSYIANSPSLTITGSNSIIKWENISLSSFNTSATRLGLLIRTAGSETSGDTLVIEKLAVHRGYSFMGFEDRNEIEKTQTRIACSYNTNIVIGTTGRMGSAIYSGFCREAEPNMVHVAHFNYNTTLLAAPLVAEANAYNPETGTAGQVRDLGGLNRAIQTIDAVSQHSISILATPGYGWSDPFKTHVVVWPKPYQ